jgi:hypothetical protein
MHLILAALCISAYASTACAQAELNLGSVKRISTHPRSASSPDEDKGQPSPQGPTGPLTTGSGGTTAASPQGGTPPNMQPVPEGSKTSADQK